MIFKRLINEINSIDKEIMKVIKKGTNIAIWICSIASVFLFTYAFLFSYIYIFLIGFGLLFFGIISILELFIIGLIFNKIYMKT